MLVTTETIVAFGVQEVIFASELERLVTVARDILIRF
jgi:hypothetical protein